MKINQKKKRLKTKRTALREGDQEVLQASGNKHVTSRKLEKLLAEIDEAVAEWPRLKMLLAIYRLEQLSGIRTHDPEPGRKKHSKNSSDRDLEIWNVVECVERDMKADPRKTKTSLARAALMNHPTLRDEGALRSVLRRLPPKQN